MEINHNEYIWKNMFENHKPFGLKTKKSLKTRKLAWCMGYDQEDPLEKEMATHSSTLAGKIPWTEEPSRLYSIESQRVRHHWVTSFPFFLYQLTA